MRKAHLPGFTAELSLDAVTHPYRMHKEQRSGNTGMVSPQWSPLFSSVCNPSTGRRWCFGMSRYHPGVLYQFDCGSCDPSGFGGPTSPF